MLSSPEPALRRVCVHAGDLDADLSLPAAVPVATLIPSIADALGRRAGPEATRYELRCATGRTMPPSTTLAQNGVEDGAVLVLSEPRAEPPPRRCEDVAEAVAAALAEAAPTRDRPTRLAGAVAAVGLTGTGAAVLTRNPLTHNMGTATVAAAAGAAALLASAIAHRSHRDDLAALSLSIVGTAFAALAGFLAVPRSGAPNVLLAASAAAVASVLAIRVTVGGTALTALSCFAATIAAAALLGVLTASPPHAVGAACSLVSLGLLGIAGRASIRLAGLSPRLGFDREGPQRLAANAIRADTWLSALLAAFSSSAAAGAIVAVVAAPDTGAQRLGCVAFAATTAALLLSRARTDKVLVFVVSGTVTAGATFAVATAAVPGHGPWVAAACAMMAAIPIYLGFVAPALTLSPAARRGVEVLESAALVAMVPLTCWLCGVYAVVHGFEPPWA